MNHYRWKLVDEHAELDGVGVFTFSPIRWGSYTPERIIELLNQVTDDDESANSSDGCRFT